MTVEILQWVRAGATADGYAKIEPILTQKCTTCHSAQSGLPVPSLTSFEDVQKATGADTGLSLFQLTRVAHPSFRYQHHNCQIRNDENAYTKPNGCRTQAEDRPSWRVRFSFRFGICGLRR